MKTVVVKTKKVVSHDNNGEAKYEEIEQKISPEMTFNKFLKYLPNQGYVSAIVLRVLEDGEEIDEVERYQSLVDQNLKPQPQDEKINYKAANEKQAKLIEDLQKRLEALENGNNKSDNREALETKASELNITFRSNIGDAKLLEKIKEIEPDFEL